MIIEKKNNPKNWSSCMVDLFMGVVFCDYLLAVFSCAWFSGIIFWPSFRLFGSSIFKSNHDSPSYVFQNHTNKQTLSAAASL